MQISKLTQKIYTFIWHKDSVRYAVITFELDTSSNTFKFKDCKYAGVKSVYTIDDWEFLKDLSTEIIRLAELES